MSRNNCTIIKIFMLALIFLLIAFIAIGCGTVKYEIITEHEGKDISYNALSDDDYTENIEKPPSVIQVYRATRIMRSTATSVWFMDENGKMQLIKADRIEINILE